MPILETKQLFEMQFFNKFFTGDMNK